jgi:hypothetical protein
VLLGRSPKLAVHEEGVLPTFLIIGAMKSGTTSLYEYVRTHPDVFMPKKKEVDYFAEELNFRRGERWYRANFADGRWARAIGEASTSYTKYPHYAGVPTRIAALLPRVQLVYVIRDPIERIRSQYLHELLLDQVSAPFEVAVRKHARYVDFSLYAMQIEQYLECFPRGQLLIVHAEQLRHDRQRTMLEVCSFLGIEPMQEQGQTDTEFHRTCDKRVPVRLAREVVDSSTYRKASRYVPTFVKGFVKRHVMSRVDESKALITDALRTELAERLAGDIVKLRSYLGDGFDGWGIA